MRKIDLVFRSVGERTADAALELAKKNIRPDRVFVIENVKPFAEAVRQMLLIEHEADFVVHMDADCLIMQDMRPFLEQNEKAYVDCYVLDKFRGKLHAGVHITRADVVSEMRRVALDSNDLAYVLRPESRTRGVALQRLGEGKAYKKFKIFHDHLQFYRDIFAKYALRELRSRTDYQRTRLTLSMRTWNLGDLDYLVAERAVAYTRDAVPLESTPAQIAEFIARLPQIAEQQMELFKIREKAALDPQELRVLDFDGLDFADKADQETKVFGIGLSRTGTKSLTKALNTLGYNILHYPTDEVTLKELTTGHFQLSRLEDVDGITDITVAPYYAQLDKIYPNCRFILTVRDKEGWLRSLRQHWADRPAWNDPKENATHMEMRRFLRAAVFGTYQFSEDRMSHVYDQHFQNVLAYFRDKPHKLLILNILAGDSWSKLNAFLGKPEMDEPFPMVRTDEELDDFLKTNNLEIND